MQNTEETMHSDLAEIGWTEEQWSRIVTTVTEEAQRARVAAQMLPVCGPELPTVVAVPNFTLTAIPNGFGSMATQRSG